MRRGLDTNVLIYAHLPSLPDHAAVRGYLQAQLADPDVTLVITAGVLHELVHVITDPRRFEPPVPMAEALALARRYLEASNIECAAVDEEAVRIALDLLDRHRLGRRRVADALLAGALMSAGVTELVTCDAGGFEAFEGLGGTIDPRAG